MKKRRRKFYSFKKDRDIIKKFKSRGSYRMTVEVIHDKDYGDRVSIDVYCKKKGKFSYESLVTPLAFDGYREYLFDYSDILDCVLKDANKVTRRWFIREARKLKFGNQCLGDFLKSDPVLPDWDKVEKDYLEGGKTLW